MSEVDVEIPSWVLVEIKNWIKSGKYGYLQLNTVAGFVKSINKQETVKKPE